MKNVFIIICCLFILHYSYAQNASFVWAKQFGGTLGSNGNALVVDAAGNVYTTGQFKGTIDCDPGPGTYYLSQPTGPAMFISKLDANGNFLWAKQFWGTNIGSYSIAIDASGNVYTTGFFQGTADFDPGPLIYNLTTTSGTNIFISKLDNNGNFVWAKKLGGLFNTYSTGFGIAVDASGNVFTTGQFDNTVDFDPGPAVVYVTAIGFEDIFISKLDSNGNFVWVKQIGATYNETASAITLDAAGNILLTGYFQGTVDFDPGPAAHEIDAIASIDAFVLKLDNDGNFAWVKGMGGILDDLSLSIATDAAGNVYTTGYFSGTCDFNPGAASFPLTAAGGSDIFILKLTANGNFAWAEQVGGISDDRGFGITVDQTGNVYATGYFQGTANLDPGPGVYNFTSKGGFDIFILKLNSAGNFLWAKQIGGAHEDIGYSIKTDAAESIYTTGYFSLVVDFNPGLDTFNLSSFAVNDVFVHKMKKCTNSPQTFTSTAACNSYTFNGHVYTTSGIYTQTFINATGCDSIVTLNLTINGSVTNSIAAACDSYSWEGQTYTSSGHYSVTYTGAGGCDSVLNLDLTINHKALTSVNATICQGRNYAGHTNPGTYVDTYPTINGCDSIRTLFLSVNSSSSSSISATICGGQSYLGHTTGGIHVDTLIAANGCDSLRRLDLTVHPRAFTSLYPAICEGQSYFAAGANQTTSGTYRDTLHTTLGCDSIISTILLVHPKPKPDLGFDRNLCTKTADAPIYPGSFSTYLWQDNSTQPTLIVSSPGKYWVTVTDTYNCIGMDTVNIVAIDTVPQNFLPANQDLCHGDIFKIAAPGYEKYLWSTGATGNNISVSNAGSYYLTVTDAHYCVGTDSIHIRRKNCIPIGIPNSFTPNKDKLNDVFKPTINQAVYQYSFIIFNRFGQLIFETYHYGTGWDGSWKGKDQPMGTYVYQVKYTDLYGDVSVNNGTVLLLR